MKPIRVAIAGVGNCASNFVQGLEYYKKNPSVCSGLMHRCAGGYDISDIKIAAAFDISASKVGKDLSEAIFEAPNCTECISEVPFLNVRVEKGPVLDGWGTHFAPFFEVSSENPVNIGETLLREQIDVLVIMIPTGAKDACYTYIKEALGAGVSVVHGIPVLASHDSSIVDMAIKNNAAIIGDDFKSQIGGTILHHTLVDLLNKRGVAINNTYQLNYAGNMDFLNLTTERGAEKHQSKKRGIIGDSNSALDISVNVSYLANQKDNKTCEIYINGQNFGGSKVEIECKLKVVDSANSSGVVCDAIRCLKIAKDRKIFGRLDAPSAFYMKSPYTQMDDSKANELVSKFLNEVDNNENFNSER